MQGNEVPLRQALDVVTNIRLSSKCWIGANTLAYWTAVSVTYVKSFIEQPHGLKSINIFQCCKL